MANGHETGDRQGGKVIPLPTVEKGKHLPRETRKAVQRITAQERRRIVLDLKAAGLSNREIREQMVRMGYTISERTVRNTVTDSLRLLIEEDHQKIEEMRALDLHRIDQAIKVLWPKVREGNLKAMREYRAFIDQRARLLGTNAAQKHEIKGEINHVISVEDKEEIRRLEEAFLTGAKSEVIHDAEVVEEEPVLLPSPEQIGAE